MSDFTHEEIESAVKTARKLEKDNLAGIELSGIKLSDANLSEVDLDSTDLTGANLAIFLCTRYTFSSKYIHMVEYKPIKSQQQGDQNNGRRSNSYN